MDVTFRTEVGDATKSEIERLARTQRTLEDVVRWGLSLTPVVIVNDVVVQDEYTHDVVIAHPSGCILVYDTT